MITKILRITDAELRLVCGIQEYGVVADREDTRELMRDDNDRRTEAIAQLEDQVIEQLRAGEEIERGFLGVSIVPVSDDLADSLGLPQNRGEFVQVVQPDGAADRAGIKAGDVVTAINGQPVTTEQTLSFLVANITPGTRIPIDLIRDGEEIRVTATVAKRPSEAELRRQQMFDPDAEPEEVPEESDGTIEEKLGLQVMTLTPQIARQLGADEDTIGLVIGAVDQNADAARKGLRRGDIILSGNYQETATIADLEAVVEEAEETGREAVLLRVQRRGGSPSYVAVRLR